MNVPPGTSHAQARLAGFEPLPIRWTHTLALHDEPPPHYDTYDRMLVVQAISEPLRPLTHDGRVAATTDLVTVV